MEAEEKKKPSRYTEAQKKAYKKYSEKIADIKFRATPEFRDQVQAHAAAMGESTNAFIKRAVTEAMKRDLQENKIVLKENETGEQ